ncbi:hypothetical protein [Nocardia beijingensis]|uniref:hypothetical protein n=1 Tax=Nocardia beijingensis TaxID=95162 RepID=UPI000832EAC7|nr:hypothetical protein [Nocardia beijingensis]
MLGFATVDRQPTADSTAVWLTSRIDTIVVRNTNAVVVCHDDPDHDTKVRSLTADHAIVLTDGTEPPLPFVYANRVGVFDEMIKLTAAHQERICQAIRDYSRRNRANLVLPGFLPTPVLTAAEQDAPQFRALTVANYVGAVWEAWLYTDEQRYRRTVTPRFGKTPWIMPLELNSPTIAAFPPEFAERVRPESLPDRKSLQDNA